MTATALFVPKPKKSQTQRYDIPCPPGLNYLPFQIEGIRFAIEHPRCLIADQMGLGKTVQAIGLCNALESKLRRILIITPASLKLNWQREWQTWSTRKSDQVCIADGDGWELDANIVIINYDLLKKHSAELHSGVWDLLICDESHYLKDPTSNRTRQVIGQWKKDALGNWTQPVKPIPAGRILFLSGTPLLNRPIELMDDMQDA